MANDRTLESPAWPVNELGEIILTTGTGSGNIAGYIPSITIPVDSRSNKVRAVFANPVIETATTSEPLTLFLAEGKIVLFKANSATSTVVRYASDGVTIENTLSLSGNTSVSFGPFAGIRKFTVTVSSGNVDATTSDAAAGLTNVESGVSIKKRYRNNLLNYFPDGTPRGIAKGSSVGALLVQCSRSYAVWGGSPTLSVVNGLNQSGAGAGTPVGVTMDSVNGLQGTPTSKTGIPSMLKCVTGTTADAISWRCILANGSGITTAGAAAALTGTPKNFGMWVWIARLPGADIGGTPSGQLQFSLTALNSGTGGTIVTFNNNQLKEGWNFLKFVDTRATDAAGTHPFGIGAAFSGDANDPFLAANNGSIRVINVSITGFPVGTTLIFDSAWTGIVSRAAFVLGCDDLGASLVNYALPKFQQYGFPGYVAAPRSVQGSSYGANVDRVNVVADYTYAPVNLYTMAAAGWEIINHTMTHPNAPFPNLNAITAPEDIRYEIMGQTAWLTSLGISAGGAEFYAAPQGATSRLSELVIRQAGIKLQRTYTQQNVQRTPWGVPNAHNIGAIGFGNTESDTYPEIKAIFDQIIAYGDVGFPFWHIIVTAGDPGDGSTSAGNSLWVWKSTFDLAMDYLAAKRNAGLCDILSINDFYYGD